MKKQSHEDKLRAQIGAYAESLVVGFAQSTHKSQEHSELIVKRAFRDIADQM